MGQNTGAKIIGQKKYRGKHLLLWGGWVISKKNPANRLLAKTDILA